MNRTPSEEYRKGLIYAFSCYLLWGLFPLYWFPITQSGMGADQILAQRICWSAVFSVAVLLLMRRAGPLLKAVCDRRLLLAFACSAAAISANWLVYLWAITHGHVLDASLGYFIAPLANVLLGRVFFKEKLGIVRIAAVLLALTGILWLAVPAGRLPWVSLLLAASFGVYGLLRKLVPLDALSGMTLETLLMLPFALGYLGIEAVRCGLTFGGLDALSMAVLVGSGAVTVIPLLMFSAAAKRITLGDLGMIQYISPSIQFFLGLTLFGEAFSAQRFAGYLWVWLGVAVYAFDVFRTRRKRNKAV